MNARLADCRRRKQGESSGKGVMLGVRRHTKGEKVRAVQQLGRLRGEEIRGMTWTGHDVLTHSSSEVADLNSHDPCFMHGSDFAPE